jgi:L-alanine-DL-glutamate epimerase-like enolase superfamily enzyme
MTSLRWRAYELPFAAPVATSRGVARVRRGWIVAIDAGGAAGYGELAPWPGFGDGADAPVDLGLPPELPTSPEAIRSLARSLDVAIEIRSAIASALADRAARIGGVSLARWLRPAPAPRLAVGALVRDAKEAGARAAEGYRTVKVKAFAADPEDDVVRVAAIRAAAPALSVRVDANRGWDRARADRACAALASLDVEYVEEPLAEPTPEAFAALRRATGVRIAADESLGGDVGPWIDPEVCDALVVKPSFVGGPLEALALARGAIERGLGVSVGTAFESAVGRAAAMAVAAVVPGVRACGLSSPLLRDLGELPPVVAGAVEVSTSPGLGVVPEGLA